MNRLIHLQLKLARKDVTHLFALVDEEVGRDSLFGGDLKEIGHGLGLEIHGGQELSVHVPMREVREFHVNRLGS